MIVRLPKGHLLALLLAVVVVMALMGTAVASAAVWVVPGTSINNSDITAVTLGTRSPAPGVVFATRNATRQAVELWRVEPSGKVVPIAEVPPTLIGNHNQVNNLAITHDGDIVFTAGKQLFSYLPSTRQFVTVIGLNTAVRTSDGPTIQYLHVEAVTATPNGQILVILRHDIDVPGEHYPGSIVAALTNLETPSIDVLAGGGSDDLTGLRQDARSVELGTGYNLLAASSTKHFFIGSSDLASIHEVRPGVNGLLEIEPYQSGFFDSQFAESHSIGPGMAADSLGRVYFSGSGFPGSILGFSSNTPSEPAFFVSHRENEPSFRPSTRPVPDLAADIDGKIDSIAALPDQQLFFATSETHAPLLFRGSGPSETDLLNLLRDAKLAADRSDFNTLKAIHETLVLAARREFIPSHQLLHTLLVQGHFPGQPSHFQIPRELVTELSHYLTDTERPDLFIPLRSIMALRAMEAEIPHLNEKLALAK